MGDLVSAFPNFHGHYPSKYIFFYLGSSLQLLAWSVLLVFDITKYTKLKNI